MPEADDAALSNLVDELLNPDRRDAVWPNVRQALWAAPERVAPRLCRLLERWLEDGEHLSVMESIMFCLEAKTREQREIVPADLLRRFLAQARHFNLVAPLCAAAMLVRREPKGILTEGLDWVLVATEHALQDPDDDSNVGLSHLKSVATDLWKTMASDDPASVVVVLEFWAAQVGWQRRSVQLLADLLVLVAPLNPDLIDDSISVLEKIRNEQEDADGELGALDSYLEELGELREKLGRKTIAQQIVATLDPAELRYHPPPPPVERQPAGPDSRVDRLIERFLLGPEWRARMGDAEERMTRAVRTGDFSDVADEDWALLDSEPPEAQLGQAMANPWPALVDGVCELVDELVADDPTDERIQLLVSQLWLSLANHPELVPVEFFQSWVVRPHLFDDEARAKLYECLAAVRPDWIVEHALSDAVGTSMVARASGFWKRIGTAYPGLLLQFAGGWFKSVHWDRESMGQLKPAFVEAAKKHPQEIDAMIELLEEHRGDPPGRDIIDFRHIEFSSLLETLRKIKKEQVS